MITRQQVRYIAKLARLRLSAGEESEFTGQLQQILDFFADLPQVEMPKLSRQLDFDARLRSDQVMSSLPSVELFGNAPVHQGRYFTVPKIIEISSPDENLSTDSY